MLPGERPLTHIGYKYNMWKVICFIDNEDAGNKKADIIYYLSILTHLLILPFTLLILFLSCLSSLNLLIRLTPITNSYSLIYSWNITRVLSVVIYGYVQ